MSLPRMTYIQDGITLGEFVLITPGKFFWESWLPDSWLEPENGTWVIIPKPFWMSVTPLTQWSYYAFMRLYSPDSEKKFYAEKYARKTDATRPAFNINVYGFEDLFLGPLNKHKPKNVGEIRFPTLFEQKYAMSGSMRKLFGTTNIPSDLVGVNLTDDEIEEPLPVKKGKPNEYGLYEMNENVSQLTTCWDIRWNEGYEGEDEDFHVSVAVNNPPKYHHFYACGSNRKNRPSANYRVDAVEDDYTPLLGFRLVIEAT